MHTYFKGNMIVNVREWYNLWVKSFLSHCASRFIITDLWEGTKYRQLGEEKWAQLTDMVVHFNKVDGMKLITMHSQLAIFLYVVK